MRLTPVTPFLLAFVLSAVPAPSQPAQEPLPDISFAKFPARVYHGPTKTPKDLHQDEDGAWRDQLDKWVSEPVVNFAGEYYL